MARQWPHLFGLPPNPIPEYDDDGELIPNPSNIENIPPPPLPRLVLTFNLPSYGFVVGGAVPEYRGERFPRFNQNTYTFQRPNPPASKPADAARSLINSGRLQRMGSGLTGMASEFALSLDESLSGSSGSFSQTPIKSRTPFSSLKINSNQSFTTASLDSVSDIAELSHIMKSSLLPTAASIVQLSAPRKGQEYSWLTPAEGLAGISDDSLGDAANIAGSAFGDDNFLDGWDTRVWGKKGMNGLLFAMLPPWYVDHHDATERLLIFSHP